MDKIPLDILDDLPQRLDSAVEALWHGDASKLEQLLGSVDAPGLRMGELFSPLISPHPVPIAGLPADAEVPGYTIVREIGRGGMGVVYEAEQRQPRRRVALKVLSCAGTDARRTRQFQREIETQARLRHPAIATVYEGGQTADGRHFFTMELVAGESLRTYVVRHNPGLRERIELFVRIVEAVAYAHERGVIHRDLKPSNILVDPDGRPHLVDFGLARVADTDASFAPSLTEPGALLGTLPYMSPEQARGEHDAVDTRSDVYSLGVILYELLTGQPPYRITLNMAEAVRTICETVPQPPGSLRRELRGQLESIILKALEKDARCRYASAGPMLDDLRRYLRGEPVLARRPGPVRCLVFRLRRHRRQIATATGLIVLAAAIGGLCWRELTARQVRARQLAAARLRCLDVQDTLEGNRPASIEEAVGAADNLHREYPELPETNLLIAQAQFRRELGRGRHSALSYMADAVRHDPTRWECAALLAEMCRATGDTERAGHYEALAAQGAPDTAEAWYLRSFATLDTARAADYAREAAQRDPQFWPAWHRLARAYLRLGRLEEALTASEHLLRLDPNVHEWSALKCQVLIRLDRLPEVLEEYRRIARLPGQARHANLWRGNVYMALERFADAAAEYSAVLAPEVGSDTGIGAWARFYRGTVLWVLGRTRDAIEDHRAARALVGRVWFTDARLYILLRDEGCTDEAERFLREARHNVMPGETWLSQVLACLAGELTPDALVAEALHDSDPEHICEAYYYAGEVFRLAGNPARAALCFEECRRTGLRFDPSAVPAPMCEYALAGWRLRCLAASAAPMEPGHGFADQSEFSSP